LSENSYEGLEENEVEKFLCLDPTPEERLIERSNNDRMRQCIAEAMKDLCEIEREIVLSRNLRAQPDTVEELSRRLGISRERLRQVERRALSKLKYELLSRGISSILA
jgi:DNA-directed RNA polymerase sigma subunit (sigma70/sigma32)